MAGRWMDERDRRDRDWRTEGYGRGEGRSPEGRSFDDRYDTGPRYADRVFGERDTGAEYNRSSVSRGGGANFERQDYTRGGRFYGDDGRSPIYRSEYGYDADRPTRSRYDNAERDHRYGRDDGRPAWQDRDYSGASPAFYRQSYGGEDHRGERGDWFEDRAYHAGQGLRRIGERVTAFLGGMDRRDGAPERHDEPRRYTTDFGREERWANHSGRGPQNYKRADERIHDDVCQRLTDDPWLDASQINVGVSAGDVTLSGFVDNREAKRRAERLVEDLTGVKNVQNDLRVGGNGLTGSGRGFGDSVLEAQMKGEATGDGSAMSRSTTRRS